MTGKRNKNMSIQVGNNTQVCFIDTLLTVLFICKDIICDFIKVFPVFKIRLVYCSFIPVPIQLYNLLICHLEASPLLSYAVTYIYPTNDLKSYNVIRIISLFFDGIEKPRKHNVFGVLYIS